MKKIFLWSCFLASVGVFSQNDKLNDSLVNLGEVIVIGQRKKLDETAKMSKSVDEYLESSKRVNLIKRGAYAWETTLNNMLSERAVITIDGMRIFGACTDKMDPITSYVETSNLSEIDIQSGQQGSHCGATIAGSIDMKRKKTPFSWQNQWKGTLQSGFESNNQQRFWLGNMHFSSQKWTTDAAISYRKADNYYDGNGNEILFSQYEKYNASLNIGRKIHQKGILFSDIIWDRAQNVGYPTLPMDVSLAQAVIASVSYQHFFEDNLLNNWLTKLYFNTIEHQMDDTTRPDVPVHMDMPGWSDTYGFFSKVQLKNEKLTSNIQLNGYQNKSTAEMTMYYRSGSTMFMYTWPKVTTNYLGISIDNQWNMGAGSSLIVGATAGVHHNNVGNDIARIFYVDLPIDKVRFLPSVNVSYQQQLGAFSLSMGTGYGQRAPSVSEAYGVYLFNSFDAYEYIGNPFLENETSYEGNFSVSYSKEKLKINAKTSYFHIRNYIVGKIANIRGGSAMMHGSNGLKAYQSLLYANQCNVSLDFQYQFLQKWLGKGMLAYAYGKDFEGESLPFIRPVTYQMSVAYTHKNFSCQAMLAGDLKQHYYNPDYGEDATPAYSLVSVSADYALPIEKQLFHLQLGVENLLDRYYSTYADWKNFPRMGRNFYVGVKFEF